MPGIKRKEASSEPPLDTSPKIKKAKTDFPTTTKTNFNNGGANKSKDYKNGQRTFSKDKSNFKPHTNGNGEGVKQYKNDSKPDGTNVTKETSKEAHAKQRALAKERKAAKPNADSIARSKKLWEQLRRKSHVKKEERVKLVEELFDIITGNVVDFVFKHDSVRVIQCAVKYASLRQKKDIARELKGNYTALAESRYAKFLVAKLLVEDKDIREMIVSEFYGHVRRLINHPEASWILDDTYRQVATPEQKAILLREWYGSEFAIFKGINNDESADEISADLPKIIEASPEKRKTIMSYLFNLINQLVQKKLTGFTMLHDAMLQYSLVGGNTGEGLSTEFLDLIKPAEEGDEDLLKNLAFTASGSRLVCRILALTPAKDRKQILRAYKESVPLLARDANAVRILIAACEVVDDTVLASKLIFPPLVPPTTTSEENRYNDLEALISNPIGRIALLYPFTNPSSSSSVTTSTTTDEKPKTIPPNSRASWLIPPASPANSIITELRDLRTQTSKKDPQIRRQELRIALLKQSSNALITLITARAPSLATSAFGCQFMTEVLLSAPALLSSDDAAMQDIRAAMGAVAELARDDPTAEGHLAQLASAGRMFKTLALGALHTENSTTTNDEPNAASTQTHAGIFATQLWERIEPHAVAWATGSSSFVIANLLENGAFEGRAQVKKVLGGKAARKELKAAAEAQKANKGAKLCLGLLDGRFDIMYV